MTTKEKILREALTLFSTRGYEAVSMRDIGRAVGVKESSLYKHFPAKQAILDAIVQMAKGAIDRMLLQLDVPNQGEERSIERYASMNVQRIADMCTDMILRQMDHEMVSKFRRMLTIEQYRDEELQSLFIEFFMDRQLQYLERVFAQMLSEGRMVGSDPQEMAVEFFAPFFMLQYRYQGDRELLIKALQTHTVHYIEEHQGGNLNDIVLHRNRKFPLHRKGIG